MSKLDWSKAKTRSADPARVQRTNDFVEPDRVTISVTKLTAKEKKNIARKQSRRGRLSSKLKAALARRPKVSKAQPEPVTISKEEKRVAKEARRIAKAQHNARYRDEAKQREAAMPAKKKSHLQAWTEKVKGLRENRETLRQSWRDQLLRREDD